MKNEKGWYSKYKIEKTDGSKIDRDACYFVLRLDTDEHARTVMKTYAKLVGGQLGEDIKGCVEDIEWLEKPLTKEELEKMNRLVKGPCVPWDEL